MLRLGIIGLGNIGRFHVQAALANSQVDLVAIADPRPPDQVPQNVTWYQRWEEMLVRSDLDAISVCVPHHLHAPMTLAALEAGKHVLVEKPLALTVEEGRGLLQKAAETDRVLMVELTHRFYPAMQQAKAFLESGKLGGIYAVEDRIVEAVSSQLLPWLQSRAQAGGGVALTNGVHMLDRVAALTGQSLTFEHGRAGFKANLGNVEDTAALSLSLEDGTPVQLLAAWPRGGSACDDELTLYGTGGTLRVWAWRGWRFEPVSGIEPPIETASYAAEANIAARVAAGVSNALQEFVEAIATHHAPHLTADAALKAQELVEEFYRYTGLSHDLAS